jgi:GNAT superfamily N-acetyltransferase
VIGYFDGKPVGFALFFHNFSTFKGKAGLYLEDIFVIPEMRGKGFGKKLFSHVADIAVQRDCPRLEWAVLDWNKPAIDFYHEMGAVALDDWTTFRLSGESLKNFNNKG